MLLNKNLETNKTHLLIKKIIFSLLILFLASCGVKKKAAAVTDPYVGVFNIIVLNVDGYGDIPIKLNVIKEKDTYKASFGGDIPIEILDTNFVNNQLEIDTFAEGYDVLFQIKVEADTVSGYMMGTFEIEGERSSY